MAAFGVVEEHENARKANRQLGTTSIGRAHRACIRVAFIILAVFFLIGEYDARSGDKRI